MGRSVTCNYCIKVDDPTKEGWYSMFGAMKYKEALKSLLEEAMRLGSSTGHIWPQTKVARRKINNIPWVTNHKGIDFLEIAIHINTPERRKYIISGKNIQECC